MDTVKGQSRDRHLVIRQEAFTTHAVPSRYQHSGAQCTFLPNPEDNHPFAYLADVIETYYRRDVRNDGALRQHLLLAAQINDHIAQGDPVSRLEWDILTKGTLNAYAANYQGPLAMQLYRQVLMMENMVAESDEFLHQPVEVSLWRVMIEDAVLYLTQAEAKQDPTVIEKYEVLQRMHFLRSDEYISSHMLLAGGLDAQGISRPLLPVLESQLVLSGGRFYPPVYSSTSSYKEHQGYVKRLFSSMEWQDLPSAWQEAALQSSTVAHFMVMYIEDPSISDYPDLLSYLWHRGEIRFAFNTPHDSTVFERAKKQYETEVVVLVDALALLSQNTTSILEFHHIQQKLLQLKARTFLPLPTQRKIASVEQSIQRSVEKQKMSLSTFVEWLEQCPMIHELFSLPSMIRHTWVLTYSKMNIATLTVEAFKRDVSRYSESGPMVLAIVKQAEQEWRELQLLRKQAGQVQR